MASTANNITCPKCKIFLRPPFKTCSGGHLLCNNCNEHMNAVSGESVASAECGDNQYPMSLLNKLLKNPSDECQYGCGHHANVVDLSDHEEACSLRCKCAVYSCPWLGGLTKVIKHVEDDHPGILVNASAVEDNFTLSFEHPVLLVTQLNKTSSSNDLYWLRLHKNENGQFIVMQYLGQVGEKVDNEFLLKEYSVTPVNYPKLCINLEVIFIKSKEDNILEDKFVESQGTDVTVFKSDTFLVKIKATPPINIKTLEEDLECFICTELMSGPIKICVNGHSFCERCCKKMNNKCPKCRKEINDFARNYALQAVAENFLKSRINCNKPPSVDIPHCWYIYRGCEFKSKNGVDYHAKECEYQYTRCVHIGENQYLCKWEGSHKDMFTHIKSKHAHHVKHSIFLDSFECNDYTYYNFYDDDCFMFHLQKQKVNGSDKYKIYFNHVTQTAASNYNYKIEVNIYKSGDTTFQGRCQPHAMSFLPVGVISGHILDTMDVSISRSTSA